MNKEELQRGKVAIPNHFWYSLGRLQRMPIFGRFWGQSSLFFPSSQKSWIPRDGQLHREQRSCIAISRISLALPRTWSFRASRWWRGRSVWAEARRCWQPLRRCSSSPGRSWICRSACIRPRSGSPALVRRRGWVLEAYLKTSQACSKSVSNRRLSSRYRSSTGR